MSVRLRITRDAEAADPPTMLVEIATDLCACKHAIYMCRKMCVFVSLCLRDRRARGGRERERKRERVSGHMSVC